MAAISSRVLEHGRSLRTRAGARRRALCSRPGNALLYARDPYGVWRNPRVLCLDGNAGEIMCRELGCFGSISCGAFRLLAEKERLQSGYSSLPENRRGEVAQRMDLGDLQGRGMAKHFAHTGDRQDGAGQRPTSYTGPATGIPAEPDASAEARPSANGIEPSAQAEARRRGTAIP